MATTGTEDQSSRWVEAPAEALRPRLGVSACLLGAAVRFDGGHKSDAFVRGLRAAADLVSVCPEVEVGLGTPRESLRLVRRPEGLRLVAPRSGRDHTEGMTSFAADRVARLAGQDLDGFVVKKDSPSCGLERVRVYDDGGMPTRSGRGLFTEALLQRLPDLVVEEEGRLCDPRLRDNFLVRLYAARRLAHFFAGPWTQGALVALHARMKLLLLAHSVPAYRALGRLVAGGRGLARAELAARYRTGVALALAHVPSVGQQVNVLQHMAGYLRDVSPGADRADVHDAIGEYAAGRLARAVPLSLVRHLARRHGLEYLLRQLYLDPYPRLFLRGDAP